MNIHFSCPRCGTHFAVSPENAGKMARCRKCGHRMRVPEASLPPAAAVASGRFRIGGGVPPGFGAEDSPPPKPGGSKGRVVPGVATMGLRPISADFKKPVQQAAVDEDEDDAFSEYKLAPLTAFVPVYQGRQRFESPEPARNVYRSTMRGTLGLVQGISELAYLITWPFILLMLLGIVTKHLSWTTGGATGVILVSIARLGLNAFTFVFMPFRHSPWQAVKYFLPPYTTKDRRQLWQAAGGIVKPALWIAGVVLVFVFVPGESRGKVGKDAPLGERVKSEAGVLKEDVRGVVDQGVESAKEAEQRVRDRAAPTVEKAKDFAQEKLDQLKDEASDDNPRSDDPATPQ